MTTERTPPKKKARELAKYFRAERVDYPYLKSVFRALREELEIRLPEARRGYQRSRARRTSAAFTRPYGTAATSRIWC